MKLNASIDCQEEEREERSLGELGGKGDDEGGQVQNYEEGGGTDRA